MRRALDEISEASCQIFSVIWTVVVGAIIAMAFLDQLSRLTAQPPQAVAPGRPLADGARPEGAAPSGKFTLRIPQH